MFSCSVGFMVGLAFCVLFKNNRFFWKETTKTLRKRFCVLSLLMQFLLTLLLSSFSMVFNILWLNPVFCEFSVYVSMLISAENVFLSE